MFAKLGGLLLLLLALGAVEARADAVYEVIGTLTIPGNSSNPGVGETINYSFELGYFPSLPDFLGTPVIVGTPIVTSFGPLGTYSIGGTSSQNYVSFFSSLGVHSEIDLLMYPFNGNGDTAPYAFEAWLYGCIGTFGLSQPFCAPFVELDANGNPLDIYGPATAAVYLVSTPEPGTLSMSLLGILALCVAVTFGRNLRQRGIQYKAQGSNSTLAPGQRA